MMPRRLCMGCSPSADVAFVIGFDSSESTLSRCSSKACSIIEKHQTLNTHPFTGIDADNYWVDWEVRSP